jgi:putative peptide zinc metalloprotease protein
VGPASVAAAQGQPSGGDTNEAVAVNTEDGGSVFRLAFSIRHVADGVVDQENLALAYASCTDCRTVALAFQVVLVMRDANYVAPVNQAGAVNDQCAECLTFASATQIVVGVDGPVVFTPEGRRRLVVLRARMVALEARIDQLTAAQLAAEVSSLEQELIDILEEELVPAGEPSTRRQDAVGGSGEGGAGSTTTTAVEPATTSTTTAPIPSTTVTTVTTEPLPTPTTTAAGG